jgi:hypothetical protein
MGATTKGAKEQADPKAAGSPEAIVNSMGKVESKTPGRTRVRVKKELRTPENMAKIQQKLEEHPDVKDVTVNERTGSVVFTHGKDKDGHGVLAAIVQDAELLIDVAFDVPIAEEEEGDGGEYGKLDQTLSDLVYQCDKWVYKRTGLRFRGQIIAGTIAAAGIAQIAIYGIGLELLPGPVLLYIAYDIYHRENKEPPLDADEAAAQTDAPGRQAADGLPAAA